jgi:hypothetical protein
MEILQKRLSGREVGYSDGRATKGVGVEVISCAATPRRNYAQPRPSPSTTSSGYRPDSASVAAIWAQSDRATITGSVTDATGAVVPGAQVTATQVNTNISVRVNTTASGDLTVPSLPVGIYQVRVESQGFRTHVRENVMATAGSTVRVDVQLEVGATQQTVFRTTGG